MRLASLLFAVPAVALSLWSPKEAAACGGCFHGEMENTQVTGHKMIFSISQAETTLWDQFSYAGDPSSFAWVLPIKGTVTIGLSSDALFENLAQQTTVGVNAPPLPCAAPPFCGESSAANGAGGGLGFDAGNPGGVTVKADQVVGPYETVQLSSQDPTALATWLSSHGYVIPSGFSSTIDAYVSEGFDFLALKLIPGAGISAMKPVRVSTMGAGASLPLRMIGAGTGVTTPITLWIFGEGRYQPTNFPWFTVTADQLVWDFSTSSSNYPLLKQAGYNLTNGKGWLLETSTPFSQYLLSDPLMQLAQGDPMNSGYADDMGNGAVDALNADLAKLWGNLDPGSLWVTRTHAELPHAALDADLTVGASPSQTALPLILNATNYVNAPACPVYPPCSDTTSSGGGQGGQGAGGQGGSNNGNTTGGSTGGCTVGGEGDRPLTLGALVLGLWLGVRRWGSARRSRALPQTPRGRR